MGAETFSFRDSKGLLVSRNEKYSYWCFFVTWALCIMVDNYFKTGYGHSISAKGTRNTRISTELRIQMNIHVVAYTQPFTQPDLRQKSQSRQFKTAFLCLSRLSRWRGGSTHEKAGRPQLRGRYPMGPRQKEGRRRQVTVLPCAFYFVNYL